MTPAKLKFAKIIFTGSVLVIGGVAGYILISQRFGERQNSAVPENRTRPSAAVSDKKTNIPMSEVKNSAEENLLSGYPTLYDVLKVIDGDTIIIASGTKEEIIRLVGMNTPEIENPYRHQECYGPEAAAKTKELLTSQSVRLAPDSLSSDRDKYGRLLRYVFLANGLLINEELVKNGYAFNYIYEPFRLMKKFALLEKSAREQRLGLWGTQCNYYFKIKR